MKELYDILNELKTCLKQKEIELGERIFVNAWYYSMISNRKNEIDKFENLIPNVSHDPTLKDEIIKNFKKEAEIIKLEIQKIEI